MANMAVSRIKREFKEVMRSEEVSEESVITKGNEMIQNKAKQIFIACAAHAPTCFKDDLERTLSSIFGA